MDVHFSFVTPAGVRITVPGTGAVMLGKTEKTNKLFGYQVQYNDTRKTAFTLTQWIRVQSESEVSRET